MKGRVPIAFYAPLKSPDHPIPSGDRTVARLLLEALALAGFDASLASDLRTLDRSGIPSKQARLQDQSDQCATALLAQYRLLPVAERPCLWFTYHVYYKAPDWIGPRVADALDIPYVVAEGSRAGKRAFGPWALGHRAAEAALDRASLVFVMTAQDRAALEASKPVAQTLVDLPPFLDTGQWAPPPPSRPATIPPRLLTVAMMREGDKGASYGMLADALGLLRDRAWSLDIVGDGPARPDVEAMLASFAPRIRFHGAIEARDRLAAFYRDADLFVWPAVNEAYGMVFLEAQAFGCPVVAGAFGGVPSVVRAGETGLLSPPGDIALFAGAISRLLDDEPLRQRLGTAAHRFVTGERSLQGAADRLRAALLPLVPGASA